MNHGHYYTPSHFHDRCSLIRSGEIVWVFLVILAGSGRGGGVDGGLAALLGARVGVGVAGGILMPVG